MSFIDENTIYPKLLKEKTIIVLLARNFVKTIF